MSTTNTSVDFAALRICNALGIVITNMLPGEIDVLREELRQIMSESYIKGSNDNHEAAKDAAKRMHR